MPSKKYLNESGLEYLWSKIKSYVSNALVTKADKSDIPSPDWNENDSTSNAYIQNRTHYKTSIGYVLPVNMSNYCKNMSSGTYNFSAINLTYTHRGDNYEITRYKSITLSDIDTSVTSATLEINGTTYTLTKYYDEAEEYEKELYFYTSDILVDIDTSDFGDDYPYVRIYANDNVISSGDTVSFYLPTIEEHFGYTKLDSNYLDGSLIKNGTGDYSEVFNASSSDDYSSRATGNYSHAEGEGTVASGDYSHAEGRYTTASDETAHAEGWGSKATGVQSHAEGEFTEANGARSHTEGYKTIANGNESHAEGAGFGQYLWWTLYLTGDAGATTYTVESNKNGSWRDGITFYALLDARLNGTVDDAIRINSYTLSNGDLATITVSKTLNESEALSNYKITAAYKYANAVGHYSHAEGNLTSSVGQSSHAEGEYTYANAQAAHTEGYSTIASSANQHVQGKYNVEDSAGTYADIVGNGTSNTARSNAYTLDWSGNGVYAGKVTVGAAPTNTMDVATKGYVDSSIPEDEIMIVNITSTFDDTTEEWVYSADKTHSEIESAFENGIIPIAIWNDAYGHTSVALYDGGGSYSMFSFDLPQGRYRVFYIGSNETFFEDYDYSPHLDSLSGVYISSPTDGQVLTYDGTRRWWENKDVPSDFFLVTVTHDETNDTYSADKTLAQIQAAIAAGKHAILKESGETYPKGGIYYCHTLDSTLSSYRFIYMDNWYLKYFDIDASNVSYTSSTGAMEWLWYYGGSYAIINLENSETTLTIDIVFDGSETRHSGSYTQAEMFSSLCNAGYYHEPLTVLDQTNYRQYRATYARYINYGNGLESGSKVVLENYDGGVIREITMTPDGSSSSFTWTLTKKTVADISDIPTKTSDLTNDSGFVTTDTNTTYTLSMTNNVITLTGSDGSTSSVTLPVYDGSVSSS